MRGIIITIVVIILLAAGVIYGIRQPSTPTKDISTNDLIIEAITEANPILIVDRKPVIVVDNVSRVLNGWYIATISSIHNKRIAVPVKVVLKKEDKPDTKFELILGPGSYFSEAEMLSRNIPDSVILELNKS